LTLQKPRKANMTVIYVCVEESYFIITASLMDSSAYYVLLINI